MPGREDDHTGSATNYSHRPPKEGIRQLFTVAAWRTALKSPGVFIANLRQGPEFLRDARRDRDVPDLEGRLTTEGAAVCGVLGVPEAEYRRAVEAMWIPEADRSEPLSVWNARRELLRMVGVIVRIARPAVMVETGVALGFTTATVLRSMRDLGHGHLYSIDLPALQYNPDDEVGKAVPPELRDRWTLELGDSRALLEPLCRRVAPVDLFLHDALHTYESQLREYRTAWPHLAEGAILVSDDVGNPAFVEFADEVGVRPWLVAGRSRGDVVGLMRKP